MYTRLLKLTMDEDGLGADLLVATPLWTKPDDKCLEALKKMDLQPRVKTLVRGAERWLLHMRVSENDGSRLSASRASEILREVGWKLAAEHQIDSSKARAA